MKNPSFASNWTDIVCRRTPGLSCATALVAVAMLPMGALSAAQQAPAQGTQIPVIVNVYSNANVSTQYIRGAIAEANKILGQANIQLVPVKINDPVTNRANGDDGDGVFTYDERQAARRFGGQEVAGLRGGRGMKISFGGQVNATNANIIGIAVHRNPTVFVQEYGSNNDTGQTIAHEAAHVLTLSVKHAITPAINSDTNGHAPPINGPAGNGNLMAETNSPGATNLTKLQIEEMGKELTNYGWNARQFRDYYPAVQALAQSGAARDDDGDAVSSGGHGDQVKTIHDVQRVWIGSEEGVTTIDVSLTVDGLIPPEGPLEALYALGWDTDRDLSTGVSYAGRPGMDRIVRILLSRPILQGPLMVDGFVEDPVTHIVEVLPGPIELLTEHEFNDRSGGTYPVNTTIAFRVPKAMLALMAPQVPVVAAGGIVAELFDTVDLVFDQQLWATGPTLRLYGSGVPRAGVPYPFTLSRMLPNHPVHLYLDDALVFSGNLNAAGTCSGWFLPPASLANERLHFLTALDQTESFAGNITSPKPVLAISARQRESAVEVSFNSLSGVDYVVERTESLNPPAWGHWASVIGTGEAIMLADPLEPGGRYYRVGMQSVDVGITQMAVPNPIIMGQELTYTLQVMNMGGPPARQVQVLDPLPAGVEFVSAEVPPPGACVFLDGMVICDLGTLLPGPGALVTIRVRPIEPGPLNNTAIAVSAAPDPIAGNDSATTVTTVLPP